MSSSRVKSRESSNHLPPFPPLFSLSLSLSLNIYLGRKRKRRKGDGFVEGRENGDFHAIINN